jgi:hypothetical protein
MSEPNFAPEPGSSSLLGEIELDPAELEQAGWGLSDGFTKPIFEGGSHEQ